MSDLQVRIEKCGAQADIAVVRVSGALDTLAAYAFQDQMHALLQTGVYKYILDFEEVEYISSAGIGVFPGMALELQQHHGRLVFVRVSAKIGKLFDMIGLTSIFEIKETLAKALEEFAQESETL